MTNTTDRTANEMFFQIVALLLSIIIIHTIYVTVIRPNAENIINKHDLEIFDIKNLSTHGGSLRYYIKKKRR